MPTDVAAVPGSHPRLEHAQQSKYLGLVTTFGPAVARVAASYEMGTAEQQDLTQDIWLAVWRALPGFRGACSERTFVFRIAHNRGVSHAVRRRLRTLPLEESTLPPDPTPGPDRAAESSEQFGRLQAALHRLPVAWREVAVLKLEGLGTGEIATVLGITEGNAAVRLNRTRERLRSLMES